MGNVGYKPKDYHPGHPSVGKSPSKVMSNSTKGASSPQINGNKFVGVKTNPKGTKIQVQTSKHSPMAGAKGPGPSTKICL